MGDIIKFESECVRCGFCCLSCTCPAGVEIYGVERVDLCPGLIFKRDSASCQAARNMISAGIPEQSVHQVMGFGQGCCISARAYKNGVKYDFAGLPDESKRWLAQTAKKAREVS